MAAEVVQFRPPKSHSIIENEHPIDGIKERRKRSVQSEGTMFADNDYNSIERVTKSTIERSPIRAASRFSVSVSRRRGDYQRAQNVIGWRYAVKRSPFFAKHLNEMK